MPFKSLKITASVFITIFLMYPLLAFSAPQWVIDGDSLNMTKGGDTSLAATPHALAPSLTFKGTTPYVAWTEINDKGISLVYVRHKEGREWVMDGGPLNISPAQYATPPAIATVGDNLYGAWSEMDSQSITQVHVKRWDGGEWVQMGGGLNSDPADKASNPVLAGFGSNLYVAWSEVSSTGISWIYVKQWDGSSWSLLGGRINKSPDRHAMTPSIVAAREGLYLGWAEYDQHSVSQVYISHWDGEKWEDMGKAINMDPARQALSPSLSIAGSNPYIAWTEYDAEDVFQIYVKMWNGKEWIRLGGSLNIAPSRHATSPSLAIKGNTLYVVWTEIDEDGINNLHVKHYKSPSWVQDGAYLNVDASRMVTAPAIAIRGEDIYVAFSEADEANIYRLYIKMLQGSGDTTAATPPVKQKGGEPLPKRGPSATFFKSIPKDPAIAALPPPLAYQYLPKTHMGEIDWMGGVREGLLKPFDSTDPEAKPSLPLLNMDMPLPVKKGFGIPEVLFPHSSHTMWLDCRNCHPTIFAPRRGGNPITMHRIIEGEYCGRCHGVVAFRLYDCFRCHSR